MLTVFVGKIKEKNVFVSFVSAGVLSMINRRVKGKKERGIKSINALIDEPVF